MEECDEIEIGPVMVAETPSIAYLARTTGLSSWSVKDYEVEAQRADSIFLSARAGSEVSAFIVGRRVPAAQNDEYDIEIYNIGVAESRRRLGIGTLLLSTFLKRASEIGIRTVWLEVRASNLAAQAFYCRLGFTAVGRRSSFYRQPEEDAVLMSIGLSKDPDPPNNT